MAPATQLASKPAKPKIRAKTQTKTENSPEQEYLKSMGKRKTKRTSAKLESPESPKHHRMRTRGQNKRQLILKDNSDRKLSTAMFKDSSNLNNAKKTSVKNDLKSYNYDWKLSEFNESTPKKIKEKDAAETVKGATQNDQKKDASSIFYKINNKTEIVEDWLRNCEMLDSLCANHEDPPEKMPEPGCTLDDVMQFLSSSTIKHIIPLALDMKNTIELLERLNSAIYELHTVQLDQLLDLFHLAIIMLTYQKLETNCMSYRIQLLDAVGELTVELQPDYIEWIGMSLCERFVIGTGKERMDRVINLLSALTILINQNSDVNREIAMTVLLATFAKVSGVSLAVPKTDFIRRAFEQVKLVDWKIIAAGSAQDMFVLVRCFSMIINTRHNRDAHAYWYKQLSSEIHLLFMNVLNTMQFSGNYNCFAMMLERFIAFCVVRVSTPRVSDVFEMD